MKAGCILLVGLLPVLFGTAGRGAVNVWAWGDNSYGQCNVPPDLTNAVQVKAGCQISAALTADGRVRVWGNGQPGATNPFVSLSRVVGIAAGDYHVIAVCADGTVQSWRFYMDPPADLTNVVAVSSGGETLNIALRADGSVREWGRDYLLPSDLTNVVAVAAGGAAYALQANGRVRAWGPNDFGETDVPAGLSNVVAIAAGGNYGLALKANGTVRAWGYSMDGATQVPPNLNGVVAISAFGHCLALRTNGVVRAWGYNYYGQCNVPTNLPFVLGISAGAFHSLALVDPDRAGATPVILGNPRSQTAAIGSTVFLNVTATGFPPLRYQWYFGTNRILNATNSVLKLTDLKPEDSGSYFVMVSNASGSATSSEASLSVVPTLGVVFVPAVLLQGGVGLTYRIDYIDAVGPTENWISLATVTITNYPQYYFDLSGVGQPSRFYRLVQLP